jgi:hypothetical protein
VTERTSPIGPIDGKSAILFLVAGGLLVVFATNTAARAFADAGVPAIHSVFGPAGFFVGTLGLFGLYPSLADRRSGLARVAGVVTAIPLVGWFAIAAVGVGSTAGVLPDASVVLPGIAFVVVFLTTILAYLLFGATSLRAGVHSRTVSVLLLAPAGVFLVLIVGVQSPAIPATATTEFVVDSGHALVHLAIGVALRTEGTPADRVDSAADTTA